MAKLKRFSILIIALTTIFFLSSCTPKSSSSVDSKTTSQGSYMVYYGSMPCIIIK